MVSVVSQLGSFPLLNARQMVGAEQYPTLRASAL
jgi:hypothetical protein